MLRALESRLGIHRSARWLEQRAYSGWEEYSEDAGPRAELHGDRSEVQAALGRAAGPEIQLEGFCHCCRRDSVFVTPASPETKEPNWRETLNCQRCGLNSRLRASMQIFEQLTRPWPLTPVYATEHTTPFFAWLRTRYPRAVGSEFSDVRVPPPEVISRDDWDRSCRREDVTALSFEDARFRALLSFDVLEHVPDYRAALNEFLRVLKPGGALLLTAPFVEHNHDTLVRARVKSDGEIEHLLPPEYHGDPVNEAGCLCFYHFGWDLLEAFRDAGFVNVRCLFYWSLRLAHLGNQQIFVANRPA